MNFFLKILNEVRGRSFLKVDGNSGALFIFNWDPLLRAYTYHPKNQDEVDDLYRTMGRATAYIFAPVNMKPTVIGLALSSEGHDNAARFTLEEAAALLAKQLPVEPPPILTPTLDDKLVEQCLFRGVVVTDDDTNETANRLIAAYDKGAADSLNSLPAVNKRPRKPAKPKATPA